LNILYKLFHKVLRPMILESMQRISLNQKYEVFYRAKTMKWKRDTNIMRTTADEGIVSLPRIVVITKISFNFKMAQLSPALENIGSKDAF
jgi:hypothetical protein